MRELFRRSWVPPIMLLLISILAYGILLPTLGFYWDDMPKLWFLHRFGPSGFHQVYEIDRPFLAWTYRATTLIIGESALSWQLFGLISHWMSAAAFWWMLRTVWPMRVQEAFWGAALFLVYPGFSQHAISLIYSHYFLIYAVFLLSLVLMIKAVRDPKRRWLYTSLALLAAAYSMFSVEYFVGLEFIRPVLLWWVIKEKPRKERLKKTVQAWLPYLILAIAYLIWRTVIFAFPTYEPLLLESTSLDPLTSVGSLLTTIQEDIILAGFTAWSRIFYPQEVRWEGTKSVILYTGVIAVTSVLLGIYMYFADDELSENQDGRSSRGTWEVVITGLFALFVAGWPFWITQLPMALDFPKDRFTLPMAFGSSLTLLGLIGVIPGRRLIKIVIIAALVGFGAGMQVHYANQMRVEFTSLKTFLWQLAWRVPDLEAGTAVLTNELPFPHYSDNSLTAPINWMYDPDGNSPEMSYILYYPTVRLGRGLPALEENLPIEQWYRATTFSGSTSEMLALSYTPPGCLHVLDVIYDDSLPGLPPEMPDVIPLSNLDQIVTDPSEPARPPENIFGSEPARGWCYYYLKADLARQQGDWGRIVELGEIALNLGDRPNNASERIPFIEGYAHIGYWETAVEQSMRVVEDQPAMDRLVCHAWDRIDSSVVYSPAKVEAVSLIREALDCSTE